jgi:hypothetical protein
MVKEKKISLKIDFCKIYLQKHFSEKMSSRVLAKPLDIYDISRWHHQYPGLWTDGPQVVSGPNQGTCALCGITPPDMKFCIPVPKGGVSYVAETPERDLNLIPQFVLSTCEDCQKRVQNEIMCCDICRRPIDPDNFCSIMKLEPYVRKDFSLVCFRCHNSVLGDDSDTPTISMDFLNPLDYSRDDLREITRYMMGKFMPLVPGNKEIEKLF